MSMLCYVLGVSSEQIKSLRVQPSLATGLAMAAMGEGDTSEFVAPEAPLDLQKSWHILHYLFTDSVDDTSSAGAALLSGEELGEDIGYGPVRLHGDEATTRFARFLQSVDIESLLAQMNIAEMAEANVYSVGDDAGVRKEVDYYFPLLKDYVTHVARRRGGLLTWLS